MDRLVKAYKFYIIDAEFGDEYPFEGRFFTTTEVRQFIKENCEVGNTVYVTDVQFKVFEPETYDSLHAY